MERELGKQSCKVLHGAVHVNAPGASRPVMCQKTIVVFFFDKKKP